MTERVLGEKGSKRRKRFLLLPLLVTTALALFWIAGAQAVHDDGIFQLDRNAETSDPGDPATTGEDWDLICPNGHADGAAECLGGTTADTSRFIDDFPPADATIFTGGGSKDDLDIPQWLYKDGAVPDKDNLLHGFAARYDDHLYFGADREAAAGDAALGVWFFQSNVAPDPAGSGTRPFIGSHLDGDVLVLTDFTKGGGAVTARVFQWNGPDGTIPGVGAINGTLDLISGIIDPPTPADCVGPPQVPDGDNACATVNTANEDSPWAYQAKEHGSPAGVFPAGHFFEGGIDLGGLGLAEECFSSFLVETRSSQSVDAVLKDFVAGQFELCGATMTTDASDGGVIGSNGQATISDSATINVTGGSAPAPTGEVLFYLCGPSVSQISTCSVAAGTLKATVNLSGATNVGNDYTVSTGNVTVNSVGWYCWFATWAGDDHYPDGASVTNFTDECLQITPRQPLITTDATADPPTGLPLGSAISDQATLSGTALDPDGSVADGTITFSLYGPDDATCATTAIFTATVNVAGNGTYNSGSFTPTAAGTYRWIAVYSGDPPNTLGVSGSCNDTNEASLIISLRPSISTAQRFVPNDSATITVATGGGPLAGTIRFRLYTNDDCTGTPFHDSGLIDITSGSGGALSRTVLTSNTLAIFANTTFSWLVEYTSSNDAHEDVTSVCDDEHSVVTINNNFIP